MRGLSGENRDLKTTRKARLARGTLPSSEQSHDGCRISARAQLRSGRSSAGDRDWLRSRRSAGRASTMRRPCSSLVPSAGIRRVAQIVDAPPAAVRATAAAVVAVRRARIHQYLFPRAALRAVGGLVVVAVFVMGAHDVEAGVVVGRAVVASPGGGGGGGATTARRSRPRHALLPSPFCFVFRGELRSYPEELPPALLTESDGAVLS